MLRLMGFMLGGAGAYGLTCWYRHEQVREGDAVVHFQSEHEHLHLHVDLPSGMEVEAGDTLEILSRPDRAYTDGEVSYSSRVRLRKASWLRRNMIKRSSLIEVKEIVEHP